MQSIVRRIRTIGNFENAGGLFVPSAGVDLARSFNGTSDLINSGTGVPDPGGQATFSFWAYPTSFPNTYNAFLSWLRNDDTANFGTYVNSSGKLAFYVLDTNDVQSAYDGTGSTTLSTNVWYQFVFTCSSACALVGYVNGSVDHTFAGGGLPLHSMTGTPLYVGEEAGNTTRGFAGYITDVAIWNTVISGAQIANLTSGQRANTIGANANLIYYLPILGQSPEPDKSGNANNGVLTGTTIVAGPPSLQPF
jgi:Concanavalin A-like lectin/glucanases superfamily